MTLVPARPDPGPHDPTTTTPARAPGSVRRTSSLDSSRPEGPGGPLVVDARARDLVTGHDGNVDGDGDGATSTVVDEVALRLTVEDATREILAIEASPPVPGLEGLVGTAIVGGFRRVLGEVLPDERRSRSLAHLLLDDLPGAVLVSGYALLRAGLVGRPRATGDIVGAMSDLCAGWAADGSMLQVTRATGVVPTPFGPPAPTIEAPGDELSWHAMAPLGPDATRRRRRLDLGPAGGSGRHPVDVHFRDTHRGDEGESVVHEYSATAGVDPATGVLSSLAARAQVLPWDECPGALAGASRLVGATLDDIATTVRRDLVGVGSCTHLNDTFRSLADVAALLPRLPPPLPPLPR